MTAKVSGEDIAYYRRHLFDYKYLRQRRTVIEDKLLELRVQRDGLHAVQYEGEAVQGTQDPYIKFCKEDDLRNKIEAVEDELLSIEQEISLMEHEVNSMDPEIRESVWLIYLLKKTTFRAEAKRKYMDTTTLRRKIDKEILKILKEKE